MFNIHPLRGRFVVRGRRTPQGIEVDVICGNMQMHPLPLRLDWANCSPTGFEWGYMGSGPAQLALAILGLVLPRHRALDLYQLYKGGVIASLPYDQWEIRRAQIDAWLLGHGATTARTRQEGAHA